jgi:peptide/nickel transport system substrate-binding protein
MEKAKQLVKECGKEGARVVIDSYSTEPYATLSTWLQSVLTEMGLKAEVQTMERAAFLDGITKSQHDIFILSWVGQVYDLDEVVGGPMFSANGGKTGNYGYYSNPDVDKLVQQAKQESDNAVRKEIYKKLIDKYVEDVVTVPLYATKFVVPHTNQLTTDNPHSYSMYDFKWAK